MTGLDLGPLSAFSFQARAWPTGLAADISEPSYRWIRSGLAAESASLAIPLILIYALSTSSFHFQFNFISITYIFQSTSVSAATGEVGFLLPF